MVYVFIYKIHYDPASLSLASTLLWVILVDGGTTEMFCIHLWWDWFLLVGRGRGWTKRHTALPLILFLPSELSAPVALCVDWINFKWTLCSRSPSVVYSLAPSLPSSFINLFPMITALSFMINLP